MGFLYFALKCISVLAWPSFALGYPLYASIRAIETNSINHMRKLITYWIIFSLISLFELAFVNLLQWLNIWPYVKLVIICSLTLPSFEGAYHAYESFLRPFLHVDIEEVISRLSKPGEVMLKTEKFLAVAEKYVEENGTESLEKLISSKVSRLDVEEVRANQNAEKEDLAPKMQSKCGDPNPSQKDVNAAAGSTATLVDSSLFQTAKKLNAASAEKEVTMLSAGGGEKATQAKAPLDKVQEEWACAMCQVKTYGEVNRNGHLQGRKHKAKCEELKAQTKAYKPIPKSMVSRAYVDVEEIKANTSAEEKVKCLDANLVYNDKKANAAVKEKETTLPPAAGEKALPSKAPLDKVQKEWACAMCQVKTTSEGNLNGHLQGKKHKAKCEELKAQTKASKLKPTSNASSSSSSSAPSMPEKLIQVNQTTTKKQEKRYLIVENAPEKQKGTGNGQFGMCGYSCSLCDVSCTSQTDLMSHLNGKKHLLRFQETAFHPGCFMH